MTDTRYETSAAVHELIDTMKGLDQEFLSGAKALADDQAVLEGYRWIFSITQVALEVYVWADTNRPRFTEIVGPYKKWGGDNSDAFYFMTRVDPSRTYRVTVDPGDAVYLSLTVYGGPDDDPFPVPTETFGWAAGDASYAMGAFELADDEALVLKGRSPDCAFWNMCLWNQFLHCFNYDYDDVTTNGSKVELDDDGSWTIVVAATDPGVPNWVSTQGRLHGRIWFRWFLPERTPDPIGAEVVKLAELG